MDAPLPIHSSKIPKLKFFPESPSSMGKEEAEKERRETMSSKTHHDSIIITVYVESSTANHNPPRRKSISGKSSNRLKHCSNRKSQLLAYAQQLKKSHSKEIGLLETNLRPKRKWSWGHYRVKFRLFFRRIFNPVTSRQGYEPMVSADMERSSRNKSNASRRNRFNHFSKRLRSMLKELSCGWKCNKG